MLRREHRKERLDGFEHGAEKEKMASRGGSGGSTESRRNHRSHRFPLSPDSLIFASKLPFHGDQRNVRHHYHRDSSILLFSLSPFFSDEPRWRFLLRNYDLILSSISLSRFRLSLPLHQRTRKTSTERSASEFIFATGKSRMPVKLYENWFLWRGTRGDGSREFVYLRWASGWYSCSRMARLRLYGGKVCSRPFRTRQQL